MNQCRGFRFPFAGGLLAGIGLGLWLSIILLRSSFVQKYGMIGFIFAGLVTVIIGVAVGLPTRGEQAEEEEE